MLVSLYTSRVVLNVLGVEDYGAYNIVGGVVAMFSFFNSAMSAATQRFLSYEIGRDDQDQLRRTFNVGIIVHIAIALGIGLLAETVGLWFVKNHLNIPLARMEAALWVYHFSILSFMISVIQVPYNALIIAHERMNIYAYLSILEVFLKLLIVFILTWIDFDKLKLYGILVLFVTLLIALIYQLYVRVKFSFIKIELIRDKELYKKMLSFSGWSMLGNGALVGSNQGISIILNIFHGVVINAAMGIANQVNAAVYGFISNFQLAFNPQIVKTYAANNLNDHRNLLLKSSKYSFLLLLLLVIPIFLQTEYILKVWLKVVPDYAVVFTKIILVNSLIDALAGPFWMSINASGYIKRYQIVISIILLSNLPLAYFFLANGFSPIVVLVIKAIINVVVLFFRMFYIQKHIQLKLQEILQRIFKPILFVSIVSYLTTYLVGSYLFEPTSILSLSIYVLTCISFTGITIFFLGLEKYDKDLIVKRILK